VTFPEPPRKKQSPGLIIGVVVLIVLAMAGIVEAAVLVTLAVTGQIG